MHCLAVWTAHFYIEFTLIASNSELENGRGGDIVALVRRRVPLDDFVMMNCICGMCPVQAESSCAKPKIERVMEMRASVGTKGSEMSADARAHAKEKMEQMKSKPESMPGPYCSIGVSACKDLDNSKGCICNQCKVYEKYNVASGLPVEHFCFNGRAA
jgi:hypothetical protein